MKFANEELRSKLAAEYVLGTMSARARRRFELNLKENPALRRALTVWEKLLTPMALALPEVEPPARVWHALETRLRGTPRERPGFWNNMAFWRFSSIASGVLALALLVIIAIPRQDAPVEPAGRMVVVMSDLATKQTAMTATWVPGLPGESRRRVIRIRVVGHAEMAPNTAWELWMLPDGSERPVSLGLITTHETQTVLVPRGLESRLDAAKGLAMSVEPASGSPTGLPTGPVLYAGECIKT